nr:septum formation family protein [Planosporangium thailandense]
MTRPKTVSAERPKGAPAVGSCWNVSEEAVAAAFPWPGAPVGCTASHTAEVFLVGQVDRELAAKAAAAKGDEAKVGQSLMYAQARHACLTVAPKYLGGDWHASRVQVVASWIKPAWVGFFGCAVVEAAAPGGKRFVPRTASLRGALGGGGLDIACVARDTTSEMRYVPCDQPHDGEFTGTYTITPPGAPFVADKVSAAVTAGCGEAAKSYIGAPRTDLSARFVGPTSTGDWLGSDQTYACYALVTDGQRLRGSVKGLGPGPLPH